MRSHITDYSKEFRAQFLQAVGDDYSTADLVFNCVREAVAGKENQSVSEARLIELAKDYAANDTLYGQGVAKTFLKQDVSAPQLEA